MSFRKGQPVEPADEVKSFYWRNHGIAVLRWNDDRIPWDTRELIQQHMNRLHGQCRLIPERGQQ